jgi:hypothetical protein
MFTVVSTGTRYICTRQASYPIARNPPARYRRSSNSAVAPVVASVVLTSTHATWKCSVQPRVCPGSTPRFLYNVYTESLRHIERRSDCTLCLGTFGTSGVCSVSRESLCVTF